MSPWIFIVEQAQRLTTYPNLTNSLLCSGAEATNKLVVAANIELVVRSSALSTDGEGGADVERLRCRCPPHILRLPSHCSVSYSYMMDCHIRLSSEM